MVSSSRVVWSQVLSGMLLSMRVLLARIGGVGVVGWVGGVGRGKEREGEVGEREDSADTHGFGLFCARSSCSTLAC